MRPTGRQPANPQVQTTEVLRDILRELRTVHAASRGANSGDPVGAARQAQSHGHDYARAYLHQRREDLTADAARQRAAALEARLGSDELKRGQPAARNAVGARLEAGREQDTLSLRRQVEAARQNLAFLKTPQGKAHTEEQRGLQAELRNLETQTRKASEAPKTFAEKLGGAMTALAGPVGMVTNAFSAMYGHAETWMRALNPTLAETLNASWQNLYATLGGLVTPAFEAFAVHLQDFTRWAEDTMAASRERPKSATETISDWRSFRGLLAGTSRDTLSLAIQEGPRSMIAMPWNTPLARVLRNRAERSGERGAEAQREADDWYERNLGEGRRRPNMTAPVIPGMNPNSQFMSSEQYAQQLQIAGLSVGDTGDPKVELMRKQLKELSDNKQLLTSIDANTMAMQQGLESLRAFR